MKFSCFSQRKRTALRRSSLASDYPDGEKAKPGNGSLNSMKKTVILSLMLGDRDKMP
jgi:hypothetical protein